MKTKRIWHAGPPPHIGWWQVSRFGQSCDMWRWWNGHEWSNPHARVQRRVAVRFGYVPNPEELRWNDYWPENARVPRLDPTDVQHHGRAAHQYVAWRPAPKGY